MTPMVLEHGTLDSMLFGRGGVCFFGNLELASLTHELRVASAEKAWKPGKNGSALFINYQAY